MTPTTRNRLIAIGALLVAAGALAFIAMGNIGENLVYYWSPKELLAAGDKAFGPTIRLGGVVAPKSIVWAADKSELRFKVSESKDGGAEDIEVLSREVPPQMFREGIGVVVEGTYDKSAVFKSNRLMVNHSNEYRPPSTDGGTHDKNWQKSLDGTASTGAQ